MPKTGLTAEQIKDRAIECTMERMRKFGYEKVRLSDIAKDLGVTHAALYAHFADKAALFDAVSERFIRDLDAKLELFCLPGAPGTALERITDWFVTLHKTKCEKVRCDPELYRAFNFLAVRQKVFVCQHLQSMERQLMMLVKEAIGSGLLHGDAAEIVQLLFNATIGFHYPAMVVEYIDQDREPLLRAVLDALYRGLRDV